MNKVKPKSNRVDNSMSIVWYHSQSSVILQRTLIPSPALFFTIHTIYLLISGRYNSTVTAVLGDNIKVLASPKFWGL